MSMNLPLPRDTSDHDDLAATRARALFISDVHLGTRIAQAEKLLDLLRSVEADAFYFVGDIIDFWRVRRGLHWPQSHNDVLQKLMRKVRKGARLVLVPGNHVEGLRDYAGMQFGGVEIHRDVVHVAAQGRRYVVMHGDELCVRPNGWPCSGIADMSWRCGSIARSTGCGGTWASAIGPCRPT